MFRYFIIILILNKVHTYIKPPDHNLEELSVNQCLSKLSTMYYHNNRSITIAYHQYLRAVDSVRSLIPLLQSESNWMLKIRSPNKYYQKLFVYLIQRTYAYQFIHYLHSERIQSSPVSQSNHWLLDIKAWHPIQATFLIASFEIVPNSTRINAIFEGLRKKNMFHVLLLIRTVKGTMFDLYIWKPVTQNCQITSGKLIKIDSCAFGKLDKGTRLVFENSDFKNCTIRAGYFEAPPYVKVKKPSQRGNSNENSLSKPILQGLEVQLLNLVTAHLGYNVIYTESKIMGDVWNNLSSFGNFQRLESAEVDIII
ncbi:Ionotropic receptor 103, partial [Diabrotica virgifera virgifera]